MHAPKLNVLGAVIDRTLSRRAMVRYAAATGVATLALNVAERVRAAVEVSGTSEPTAPAVARRARRGTRPPGTRLTGSEVDQLSELTGVSLAVEWAPDGTLKEFVSNVELPRDIALNAAQYGAAVSAMAPGLADAYSRTTELTWAPYRALVVCGGEWAAVIGNTNKGVWVRAAEADFNQLIATLGAESSHR